MQGRSYKEDCLIPRSDLRYLIILHRNMEGQAVVGELVVNKEIADDILAIMRELYDLYYPIEQVRLVDYYEGVDELSMAANNSSAFNWRPLTGSTTKISRHAMGMAIDINPLYNPYYKFHRGVEIIKPEEGEPYVDRMWEFPYIIEEDDVCYQLFMERGFKWGGDWNSLKDYQHFEK
ncbi:MAG: M15 family metallopeptidase [Bacteroidaceae bacterium]|nr:M15 family metallopeptidase [Bacteroidaceae bacterium]